MGAGWLPLAVVALERAMLARRVDERDEERTREQSRR